MGDMTDMVLRELRKFDSWKRGSWDELPTGTVIMRSEIFPSEQEISDYL